MTTLPSTSAAKALWLPTTALTDTEDSEETEAGKLPPVRLSPQGCREPSSLRHTKARRCRGPRGTCRWLSTVAATRSPSERWAAMVQEFRNTVLSLPWTIDFKGTLSSSSALRLSSCT